MTFERRRTSERADELIGRKRKLVLHLLNGAEDGVTLGPRVRYFIVAANFCLSLGTDRPIETNRPTARVGLVECEVGDQGENVGECGVPR